MFIYIYIFKRNDLIYYENMQGFDTTKEQAQGISTGEIYYPEELTNLNKHIYFYYFTNTFGTFYYFLVIKCIIYFLKSELRCITQVFGRHLWVNGDS